MEQLLDVSMLPSFPYKTSRSSYKVKAVARYALSYESDICTLTAIATLQDLKSKNVGN
jgi:hypothetical protein